MKTLIKPLYLQKTWKMLYRTNEIEEIPLKKKKNEREESSNATIATNKLCFSH